MSYEGSRGRGRNRRGNRPNYVPPKSFRSQSAAIATQQTSIDEKETWSTTPLNNDLNSNRQNGTNRAKSSRAARDYSRLTTSETTMVSIAKRPDPGGTAGRKLTVLTNHFKFILPQFFHCYQYDIEIETEYRDGTWRPAKREDRVVALKKIAEREHFPFFWFDEGKSLFSLESLQHLINQYDIRIKDTKTDREQKYRLRLINLVNTYDIQTIWDFLENRLAIRPRDPIRVFEILLKQTTMSSMICVKNQFYDRQQTLEDLGDGRGLARGSYQAIFLTKIGATMNINSTFTCFYQPWNLVEYLSDYLQSDIGRNGIDRQRQEYLLDKVLRSLWIETRHTEVIRKYRVRAFGRSSDEHTFTKILDDGGEERQTVAQYFREKYRIQLRFPHLPTVELYTNGNQSQCHYLPMECCFVQEWQRAAKPMTGDQRARISKKTVLSPTDRYQAIMKIVEKRRFNEDKYLQEIGMTLEDQRMITVRARCINPPEIKYRSGYDEQTEVVERISFGKWNLKHRFQTTMTISRWACVMISSEKPRSQQLSVVNEFVFQFPRIIQQYGIYFQSAPMEFLERADLKSIHDRLDYLKQWNCEVVLFILNNVNDEIYKAIKYFGNQKLGIVTQCTDFVAIARNINSNKLSMYLQNLVQKFNAKLGGVNGIVSLTDALTISSAKDDVFMFFGADVTHTDCTKDKPSIAALIGSTDPTSTLYASRISEQYPLRGRVSLELIKDLYQMSTDLLKLYAQRTGCLPNKIVFYRDGVDDGHFQKVLDNEVRALKNACRALYMNSALPKITFIIVKKRHNTRFFVSDPAGRTMNNISPGTVIDTEIVHPHDFDFYLNSHVAIQGTCNPILYHVLYDEIGFSSDEIQSLTYYLCHTDVRCTKAVSVPAPVHYAHLAAYQSRLPDHLVADQENQSAKSRKDEDDEGDDEFDDTFGASTLKDVQSRLIHLDPSIQDTMWYV